MLEMLYDIPEDFPIKVSGRVVYIARYSLDGNTIATLVVEDAYVGHLIHFDVKKFGPKSFKKFLEIWDETIIPELKIMGVERLAAAINTNEVNQKVWSKFISYFGFSTPIPILYSEKCLLE